MNKSYFTLITFSNCVVFIVREELSSVANDKVTMSTINVSFLFLCSQYCRSFTNKHDIENSPEMK